MPSFTPSQIALLAAPPILLGTTYLAFKKLATWLGLGRGYLTGFLVVISQEMATKMLAPQIDTLGHPQ